MAPTLSKPTLQTLPTEISDRIYDHLVPTGHQIRLDIPFHNPPSNNYCAYQKLPLPLTLKFPNRRLNTAFLDHYFARTTFLALANPRFRNWELERGLSVLAKTNTSLFKFVGRMRRLRVHVAGSGWSVLSLIGEGAAGAWGSRNERGRRTALDLDASSTTVWAAVDGDRHVVAAHRDTYMPVTWPNMLHKDVVSDESQQQRFARVLANKVSEEVEGMPVELRADDVVRLVDVVGGLVEEIARCWAWMPNDEWEVKGAKEESWTLG